MHRRLVVVLAAFLVFGCKGEKGEKGDPGLPGADGFQGAPGQFDPNESLTFLSVGGSAAFGSATSTNALGTIYATGHASLPGTGTLSSSGTTVTGSGTAFTTELRAGDTITIGSQSRSVASVDTDISLTTAVPFNPPATSSTFAYSKPIIRVDDVGGATRLIANDSGNIGIGTATPATFLDIEENALGAARRLVQLRNTDTSFANTAELSILSGSSDSWMSIGKAGIEYLGNPGFADFGYVESGGAGLIVRAYGASSVVKILTGAAADERMRIDSAGNVGIGTTAPDYKLRIVGGSAAVDTGQGWLTVSDARAKKNVVPLDHVLAKLDAIRAVRYDALNEPMAGPGRGRHLGVIAQEVEAAFPEIVYSTEDGLKSVAYDKLAAVAVQGVKELKAENELLRRQNAELVRRLERLEAAVSHR